MQPVIFNPVGLVHTIYKEKFGIPRQSGLVDAQAIIEFFPEFAREEAVRELDRFSHIWVLFYFHQAEDRSAKEQGTSPASWTPMVRPPRLGGNKKVGVFASRSPFRPNRIGMSVVKLDKIEISDRGPKLHVSGADLLDKTPVLDIKPYLPYSDSVPEAEDHFVPDYEKRQFDIEFSDKAMEIIQEKIKEIKNLEKIICQILQCDPRPAYQKGTDGDLEKVYGMKLFDFDLRWKINGNNIKVLDVLPV